MSISCERFVRSIHLDVSTCARTSTLMHTIVVGLSSGAVACAQISRDLPERGEPAASAASARETRGASDACAPKKWEAEISDLRGECHEEQVRRACI